MAELDDAVKLEDAYKDLSREAFAVWIRLMVETESELCAGLGGLASKLRYRERGFFKIIAELRNKGYVRVKSPPLPGKTADLIISKRALLVGYDQFVKLS